MTLQTPAGAAAGAYPSTTSDLTGSQDDGGGAAAIASGFTAADSLTLFAAVPQVVVSGPAGPVGEGVGFTAAIEFSEPVTGFVVGDITVVNGVASALSGDGRDFTATITPAATGTVEVSVGAGVAQDTDTNLNAASNTFTVQAVAAEPEIEVQIVGAALAIIDGSTSASTQTLTDFGNVDVTAGLVTRTVRVSNTGTGPLTFISIGVTPTGPSPYSLNTVGSTPVIAPGASTTFSIIFNPSTIGTHVATYSVNTDDADEAAFDFVVSGTGVTGPEIEVRGNSALIASGDASASAADHTEFPDAAIAATQSRTFTINNLGGGALTLGANAVSITNDAGGVFSVSDQPATSIASSGADTFTVNFTPNGAGLFNALLSIANDDPDENPYTFVIQGTGLGAPEVQLEGNSIEIVAGDTSPATADGTAFGSILSGTTATANFTIRNTGTTNLTLTAPSGARDVIVERVSGSSDFTVSAQPGGSGTIAPGGSQVFTIQYAPTTDGADTAVFGFANTDAGESPYQFTVSGEGVTPEIAVAGLGGADITNGDGTPEAGDGTDFGATGFSSGAAITRTFTISNPGTGVLTLGANAVSLSGAGVGDWTVTTQPAATVAPNGGTTTFEISFDPTEQLVRSATVSIANDDGDESPFTFAVKGTGADDAAPTGYTVAFDQGFVNGGNETGVSFTFADAEIQAGYAYTITSDAGMGSVSGSGTIATAADQIAGIDVSSLGDGTLTLSVALTDAATNEGDAATDTVVKDTGAPGVSIATAASAPVNVSFEVSFTFTEAVTGFVTSDIVVTNGVANNLTGSGLNYTADIFTDASGTVTVDVPANVAVDGAGNANTAATQLSIEADKTAPTVAISTTSSDPVSGPFTAIVTFSEAVTGLEVSDFVVLGGSAANLAGSGTNYTIEVTPEGDGTVTIDLPAGSAFDAANIGNADAPTLTIESDGSAPGVAITTVSSDPVSGAFTATFTFTEGVTGFALGDISVGNGSASNFSATSASVYTADITPAADGAVTVDVAASVAADAAGNGNTAAPQFSITNDATAPTVTSVVVSDADLRLDNVGDAFTLTVTFSEPVDPAVVGTVAFDADLAATLSTTDGALNDDNTAWVLTATVLDGGQSVEGVEVQVSGFADGVGNSSVAYTEADVFAVQMARAGLTVSVDITGSVDGAFSFSGDLGDFQIDTSAQSGEAEFATLAEGDYTFTLADPDGFSLDTISCTGAEAVTDPSSGEVTVTLDPADSAECAFGAIADPGVDPDLVIEVPLALPASFDDPTSISATFPLTNTGGAPLDYRIDVDVLWLSVTPNEGTIPAGGTVEFTVAFTDAVLDLEPGEYTATISFFNLSTGAAAATPSGATGTQGASTQAIAPFQIPVTVQIVQRAGTLTLVATAAQSDLAGEAQFLYQSEIAAVSGQSIDTLSGTGSIGPLSVDSGAYAITQTTPEGWRLDSISCAGDTDGGSSVDLAAGVLNVDLDAGETLVCTFANVPDEAYVRGVTTAAIREFMAQRADQILSNAPRLTDRLRRGRQGGGSGFGADFTEGRFNTDFATSLSAMRTAGREGDPFARDSEPAYAGYDLSNIAAPGVVDVWVQATYAGADDNRAGQNSRNRFGMVYLGADMMLSPDVLAGVLVQFDHMETSTGVLSSEVEGDGWLAGPYVAMRLGEGLYVDARAAWGRSDNSVNPLGTYWDDFETDRWLLEANIVGDIRRGAWRFSPAAGLAWFDEESGAYIDSLGFDIPSQSVTIGRARFEPELAYRIEHGPQSFMEPYVKLTANYDFEEAEVFNAAGGLQGLGAFRVDGRVGFNAGFANGAILGAEIALSGIGEDDFDASSAMIRLRTPLALP